MHRRGDLAQGYVERDADVSQDWSALALHYPAWPADYPCHVRLRPLKAYQK